MSSPEDDVDRKLPSEDDVNGKLPSEDESSVSGSEGEEEYRPNPIERFDTQAKKALEVSQEETRAAQQEIARLKGQVDELQRALSASQGGRQGLQEDTSLPGVIEEEEADDVANTSDKKLYDPSTADGGLALYKAESNGGNFSPCPYTRTSGVGSVKVASPIDSVDHTGNSSLDGIPANRPASIVDDCLAGRIASVGGMGSEEAIAAVGRLASDTGGDLAPVGDLASESGGDVDRLASNPDKEGEGEGDGDAPREYVIERNHSFGSSAAQSMKSARNNNIFNRKSSFSDFGDFEEVHAEQEEQSRRELHKKLALTGALIFLLLVICLTCALISFLRLPLCALQCTGIGLVSLKWEDGSWIGTSPRKHLRRFTQFFLTLIPLALGAILAYLSLPGFYEAFGDCEAPC
mmetsp:Transcript_25049/g.50881  ORF Transcript_25049/g.50881 Transcript_25049/m.50881 type:complete len:406 (+) Transcript_25049:504-1721(+)|eukprot:CAMPEP_0181291682 /NCGR_PEP_ID=MMETSP1101-20121128/2101_1 /TAXON_ID=46948 /ORGANISM="Rhodomonas abbreviata, Strain Caron Lab Isolate" /LENGTH=405 /DNA_ID=CAMNT_0023396097 /DNA_START=495 /DNA_END=1712 /DNA_ORIENTATION=-